jgi:predicted amidohydrolase YtcJ
MRPQQIKIKIRDGFINSIEDTPGKVVLLSENQCIDIDDAWLYPGFVDAHGHIITLGWQLNSLNLNDCCSAAECVAKALEYKERRGMWLVGRGWNHENWQKKVYPRKEILDNAFADIPVSFSRVDGHALWVNSLALKLTAIDSDTLNPLGGAVLRSKNGEPNGILIDNAMSLISDLLPPYTEEEIEEFILAANNELLRYGITEVHDMDVKPSYLPVFKRLDQEGRLEIRIQAFVQGQNDEWKEMNIKPYHGNMFHVIGVKFYVDGALGSHGAAMTEPYSDMPDSKGLLLLDEESLYSKASAAIKDGFFIATHAIGDEANRMVINVYERLRNDKIAKEYDILRIEHAQILHREDLLRLTINRIYASMQPVHCLSDAPMARKRIGGRVKDSYLWKSLMSADTVVTGGSDFPIESHNPVSGLDAFIHRIPFGEKKAWVSGECITPEEAIDAYSFNAHIVSGNAATHGKIKKGYSADFTVLDKDIRDLSHNDFPSVQVVATVVAGEIRYFNEKYTKKIR